MTFASPPLVQRSFLVAAALGTAACAGTLPDVEPVDLPRLESAVAASPEDTRLRVQLGMAQFKAGDFETARGTLQGAIEAGDESPPAFLYLGMAQEELFDWAGARDAYTRYLEVGVSVQTRNDVRRRLTLIGRNLLRAQARQALAREEEITATAAFTPRSIAVMPMAFNSTNTDLEPLIYALADMMVTDFKVSNALTVLERAQIQTLLDEMALTAQGYAEAGTGARAGRLLRAEHVVQGVLTTLDDDELQSETDVLDVRSAESAGTVSESAALERIFDMEKQIVIGTIRDVLGLELTPAEEQRILDNRMDNVLAFLAHGRGLRALDRGDLAGAQAAFQQAIELGGGGYEPTEVALAETEALASATSSSTDDLAGVASTTGEVGAGIVAPPPAGTTGDLTAMGIPDPQPVGAGTGDGSGTDGGVLNTLRNISEGVDPTPTAGTLDLGSATLSQDQTTQQSGDTARDPVQEQNDSGLAGTEATIRIVIQRPGGLP